MPEGEWLCVAAGSEGWLGHYLTWFVPGVGEFFHFTWGLERKQGPCIWGIITFFFYSKANAPYFPGVGGSIDRCKISTETKEYIFGRHLCIPFKRSKLSRSCSMHGFALFTTSPKNTKIY